jgi:hypothetical protein
MKPDAGHSPGKMLECPSCGLKNLPSAAHCGRCKTYLGRRDMPFAPYSLRVKAGFIDLAFLLGVILVLDLAGIWILMALGASGDWAVTWFLLVIAIALGYQVIFFATPWRATPGQRITGIRVVSASGGEASVGQIIQREHEYVMTGMRNWRKWLPENPWEGMRDDARLQAPWDRIAGTVVVYADSMTSAFFPPKPMPEPGRAVEPEPEPHSAERQRDEFKPVRKRPKRPHRRVRTGPDN